MTPDEEIKIETEYGQLTGLFFLSPINEYQNVYTAWFKEFQNIIVESETIESCIKELKITLDVALKITLEKELKAA